jgi:hypothetical protein
MRASADFFGNVVKAEKPSGRSKSFEIRAKADMTRRKFEITGHMHERDPRTAQHRGGALPKLRT